MGIRTHPGTCRWPGQSIHVSTSPSFSILFLTGSRLGEDCGLSEAYLVRERQRQLDLVGGNVGVTSAGEGSSEGSRADAQSGAGDTEGVHYSGEFVNCAMSAGAGACDVGPPSLTPALNPRILPRRLPTLSLLLAEQQLQHQSTASVRDKHRL